MVVAASPTFAGRKVTSARVTLPAWGAWHADVAVDGEVTLSGAVQILIADLVLKGTILSGGPATGRSYFRVVGGAGGWGKPLKKKSYANDAGVKLATILGDAAQEVGETLDLGARAGERIGPAFARPSDPAYPPPAARLLEQYAPGAWYIGEDGITHLGKRAAGAAPAKATRTTPLDLAHGRLELASETIATILPGVVVDGLEAIDVVHEISAKGGLRSMLYGKLNGSSSSRRLDAFRALFDQLDPDRNFRAVWEYRVVSLEGKRVNLQPVLVSTGMPDLRRIPIRPGLAGSRSDLLPGARVLVGFVNADPGRPEVFSVEDADGEGFKPVLTEIDAQTLIRLGAGLLPVARAGDLAGGVWPIIPTQVKVLA